jgi:O-antigen/teichoic acid export membrane protein
VRRTLLGGGETSTLERRVAGNAVGTLALKVAAAGLSFFSALILTRSLGAAEYGLYVYALAWVNLLSIQTLIGFDRLLVREMAGAGHAPSAWGTLRGLLRRSRQIVTALSVVTGLAAVGVGWVLAGYAFSPRLSVFAVASLLLPLLALTRLTQSAMQGLHRVVASQVPETLVHPAFFIVLIGAASLFMGAALTARAAAGVNVLAASASLLVAAALLRRYLPNSSRGIQPAYKTKAWLSSAVSLMTVSAAGVVTTQAPLLLLGAIKGARNAGIYAVAARVSDLITFVLISVNVPLAPAAAKLWAERDVRQLQLLATKSVRAVLALSLPVGVGLIVFGGRVLSLFGREFAEGQVALVILCVGQIVDIGAGPVGVLLLMAGHERDVAVATGACAVLNVVMNAVMIPPLGAAGAALAVASSLALRNILLAVRVRQRLGIHSTALGRI